MHNIFTRSLYISRIKCDALHFVIASRRFD